MEIDEEEEEHVMKVFEQDPAKPTELIYITKEVYEEFKNLYAKELWKAEAKNEITKAEYKIVEQFFSGKTKAKDDSGKPTEYEKGHGYYEFKIGDALDKLFELVRKVKVKVGEKEYHFQASKIGDIDPKQSLGAFMRAAIDTEFYKDEECFENIEDFIDKTALGGETGFGPKYFFSYLLFYGLANGRMGLLYVDRFFST